MKTLRILHIFILLGLASYTVVAQTESSKKDLTDLKRDQFIQSANALRAEGNYFGAIIQLDSVLFHRPDDTDIMLYKGDLLLQSKRYAEASAIYEKLLPTGYKKTIVRINLSYALFMNHRPSKALFHAKLAWQEDTSNVNAIINYFNAMLWNRKTREAAWFLEQEQDTLSRAQQLVMHARLHSASGDHRTGMIYYDSLVSEFPEKYYILEYAEVLLGKKEVDQSENLMVESSNYFTERELNEFDNKIEQVRMQQIGSRFEYFKDVGNNSRIESSIYWQQDDDRQFRTAIRAGLSSTRSLNYTGEELTTERIESRFINIGISQRWNRFWKGQTEIHTEYIQPMQSKAYIGLSGRQLIQYSPTDRRMYGLYYKTDILNYTAGLLEMNIRNHNIGYLTHIMFNGNTGFFSEGSLGTFSDGNSRWQFFGSLYYLFRTEPTLKAGYNFSLLHYADNMITNYFSPDIYLNNEVFIDFMTPMPLTSRFYLHIQPAMGVQKIEEQKWEPIFRIETQMMFRYKQLNAGIRYQASNVAASTGVGYKFNSIGFHLSWKW